MSKTISLTVLVDDAEIDCAEIDLYDFEDEEDRTTVVRFSRDLAIQSFDCSPVQFANALRKLANRIQQRHEQQKVTDAVTPTMAPASESLCGCDPEGTHHCLDQLGQPSVKEY